MSDRAAVTRARVAVALMLVAVCGRASFGQQLNVTRYATAGGLPSAGVLAVLQDSRGYMWFGTSGGLARYDGSTFQTFTTADGLTGNTIVALAEDRDGRLYAAALEGGVSVLEGNAIRALATDDAAADRTGSLLVSSITAGGDGHLWLSADDKLIGVGAGGVARRVGAAGLPADCCRTALRDRSGRLWIGTEHGLFQEQGGVFRRERGPGDGVGVNTLLEDASGDLWAGTDRGLSRRSGGRWRSVESPLGAAVVLAAASGPDDSLWFGTDRGALRVESGSVEAVTVDNGLPDEAVRAVTVDREGNVWFGTDSGVAKLVDSDFASFTVAHGLPANYVVDVADDPGGGIWVLHRRGLASIDGVQSVSVDLQGLAGSASFTSLARLDDGHLVLGSTRGAFVWNPRTGESRGPIPNTENLSVTALAAEGRTVWVGTARGLYRGSIGGVEPARTALALSWVRVTAIETGDGRTWIGTQSSGLFTHFRDAYSEVALPGPRPESIWDLAVSADGSLWAGTNGLGALRRAADGTILRLTRDANGLASDFVQQVLPTSTGRVWIYTNRGLDSWDPAIGITHHDLAAGLADMAGNPGAAVEGRDGRLWFGTPSGLTVQRSGRSSAVDVPPVVVIGSVLVDGVATAAEDLVTLTSSTNEVTFHFTALSYRDEGSTRYRYRLRGRSDAWSRPSLERRVSFAGLSPGDFVFEVQAINGRGLWSNESAAVKLRLLPAAWQTAHFRWALAAIAAFLAAIWIRRRLRSMETDRRHLRNTVEERTRELVEKNSLLERMATTDELTALPNRRFFLDGMERELRKMTRLPAEQPLSLLLLDLDRFKSINDRFGHAAGDEVLRRVSRRLAQSVRATDLPARYGGEEFAILLANTDREGARFLAEKLRSDVEAMRIEVDGNAIPVTISVGVATISAVSRYDPRMHEDLLREADEAMYRAKTNGRNRVEMA